MIEVTSLDHNGRGIAKLNKKVVFINNALPGEFIDIKITNEKSNYIEADAGKIIKKSSKRINPLCPYFYECGGCDLLHVSYDDQLLFKKNKIQNIIDTYLNEKVNINKIIKCDNSFNYRNKVTFQVNKNIGFYKNKSYKLINIDNCLIANELINKSIEHLNKLDLKYIKKITCRTGLNKLMIIIETNNIDLNINCIKDISNSIYLKTSESYNLVYGDSYIYEMIGNYKFAISPDSFFQINNNICNKLYNKIKEYVKEDKKILDLYCGTGSIGIFLSSNNEVLGVEINKSAIEDAKLNKKMNNINNINFICGDSGNCINNLNFKPDIIIIDPPRSGLNKKTLNNIIKLNPERIIYVSCNPMSLIRDLNLFDTNYKLAEITPFDMFPNTKHVECVSVLHRR